MSVPLVADIEHLTCVLCLLQIKRILHECSSCYRYRGSYMSALTELIKRVGVKDKMRGF